VSPAGENGQIAGRQSLSAILHVAGHDFRGVLGFVREADGLVAGDGPATASEVGIEEVHDTGAKAHTGQECGCTVHRMLLSCKKAK
jgi:hypothetical protein